VARPLGARQPPNGKGQKYVTTCLIGRHNWRTIPPFWHLCRLRGGMFFQKLERLFLLLAELLVGRILTWTLNWASRPSANCLLDCVGPATSARKTPELVCGGRKARTIVS